jgi:hypothetical protein
MLSCASVGRFVRCGAIPSRHRMPLGHAARWVIGKRADRGGSVRVILRRMKLPMRPVKRSGRSPARGRIALRVRLCLLLSLLGGCVLLGPPATRSPLKEKLAPLSSSELEEATRTCLQKTGWKVDELPTQHGDIRVLHAKKANADASLYLHPEGIVPRITGDLANGGDALWPCLESGPNGDKPDSDKPEADAGPASG